MLVYKSTSNLNFLMRLLFSIYIILTLTSLIFTKPALATMDNITVVLDWTPNTNHTGIIVANQLGFYKQLNLSVSIVQAGKNSAEQLVARNQAQFGISSESNLVEAYLAGMPLISIAAIIAHDTSGFYSLNSKHIVTPKDFEGKTYGSWGSELEIATIKAMMQKYHANFNKVKIVTIGNTDFFQAKDIDFVWGFQAWTGVQAKVNHIPVNFISVKDTINLDGYTPIIITNKPMIKHNKAIVTKFMEATIKGYLYAIAHPKIAARILLKNYPELNEQLVVTSQLYLTNKYKDVKYYWGYQQPTIWKQYLDWMYTNKLINHPVNYLTLFTNHFIKNYSIN